MITPNPELNRVQALRKAIKCLQLEVPGSVWEDVNTKVEAVIADVLTFNERHVLHQNEQRDSSEKLEKTRDSLNRCIELVEGLSEQQAMEDYWYVGPLEEIKEVLKNV